MNRYSVCDAGQIYFGFAVDEKRCRFSIEDVSPVLGLRLRLRQAGKWQIGVCTVKCGEFIGTAGSAVSWSVMANEHARLGAQGFAQRLARDEYETQFQIFFEQIVAYAAGTPTNVVNLLAIQKRHAQAHQVVESIPVHHVLTAIDNVEIDFRVRFLQQFGAFTGVGAVFAAK